jgi:DNA polymerase III alpha subunit (gram-positive type)
MDQYIDPETPLSEKIIEITGITDDVLKGNPTEREIGGKILDFMCSCPLWIAYNCKFDLRMLRQMADRIGIHYQESVCLDGLEMARDLINKEDTGDYKLAHVTEFLYPELDIKFHSAIEDVAATAMCISYFLREYRKIYDDIPDDKMSVQLKYAYFWQNPHRMSQQRICLVLSEGEKGAIYWDLVNKCWSHKSNKISKELFEASDLDDIESQFIYKYGWRYHSQNLNDIINNFVKDTKERRKVSAGN